MSTINMKQLFIFLFLFFFSTQISFAQLPIQYNGNPFGVHQVPVAPSVDNIQTDPEQAGTGVTVPSIACTLPGDSKAQDIINYATCIISHSIIPLIMGMALVVFIWGVVQYIAGAEEEAKREKGRQFIIWGLIAITVIVSIYGMVQILGDTFGIQSAGPQLETTP
ncbi:MAG: hypothetical protein V4504_00945 [Patescibacteria group bacterium]